MCVRVVCLAVLCSLSADSRLQADDFSAGAAVVDITPPVPYRMSGYFSERVSTGVKDPLYAKALVLKQGNVEAALVFCDLIGIAQSVGPEARRRAANETGIPAENIAISATHSHTGPLYAGVLRNYFHDEAVAKNGSDPFEKVDYPAQLVEKLVEAIRTAQKNARPAKLSAGAGQESRLSFNRRFHMKDGTVRFNPGALNPDIIRPAGPIDPDVGLLRFVSGGKTAAIVTVFAMHLDTTGGTEYSGDYPRYLSDALQKELGDQAVSFFGAGTCGDINHVDVTTKERRKTPEIGALLAETVRSELPRLQEKKPRLAVRCATVEVPLQKFPPEKIEEARERLAKVGTRELSFLDQVEACKIMALELRGETAKFDVQAFRLADDVALVTLPGEVFVELGLAIKKASPFKTTLVVELANDNPAYVPTKKAFAEGSYETVNSLVAPGGGEMLAEAALRLLNELRP
ncbi:MAG: neutral/alkaline non-lysosomal ceramidase N-terminal domain-containing protein [Planctomycetia bacterium]|nr:neutral/alkaline non-lysosomal ceramidase N-terminal domain-containing protein [Planctomycetia bacterium]